MDTKMVAGMYDIEETLGSGHFAVVKLARHVITGDHVAVKVIDKTKLDKQARDHLFQEVHCMKLVQHPSIIRLYQVIDTQTKLYLILELGENGDLYEYISKNSGGVGEEESRDLFRQIVEAISYCHRHHVVHRDLKPENVVFCQNAARVKLTDFGLSNLFAPGEMLKTACGSLSYAAPEILLGDMYDAPAVDLWSLGVILYMLLVGEKPFVGGTDSETLTMIMDCKFEMPTHFSPESVDLVKKLLVSNPKDRLSLEEIFAHPWMRIGDASSTEAAPTTAVPRTQQFLPDHARQMIIAKMMEKGVADLESIQRSLESNAYDHIAATFYLMAEAEFREKEGPAVSPVSDVDLERLDRRRQRVRKLSTPGSPSKPLPDAVMSPLAEEPRLLTFTTPNRTSTLPRNLPASSVDGSGVVGESASSPGRYMRRGAAETGVLRPVRRTSVHTGPMGPMGASPNALYGASPHSTASLGRNVRRASMTCRLSSAPDMGSSSSSGNSSTSGGGRLSNDDSGRTGTLQFSLPVQPNVPTTTAATMTTSSSSSSSKTGSSSTNAASSGSSINGGTNVVSSSRGNTIVSDHTSAVTNSATVDPNTKAGPQPMLGSDSPTSSIAYSIPNSLVEIDEGEAMDIEEERPNAIASLTLEFEEAYSCSKESKPSYMPSGRGTASVGSGSAMYPDWLTGSQPPPRPRSSSDSPVSKSRPPGSSSSKPKKTEDMAGALCHLVPTTV